VAGIKSDEYAIVLIRDRELAVAPRPEDLGTPALPFEVLVDERADCGTWPRTVTKCIHNFQHARPLPGNPGGLRRFLVDENLKVESHSAL
jgi:hypothetical protein